MYWWLLMMMAVGVAVILSGFQNELSWDGIITIVGIILAGVFGVAFWWYRSWRSRHLLRVDFARDSYKFEGDESERRFFSHWEFPVGGPFSVLARLSPHEGAQVDELDVRVVRRSFPLPWLWRRVDPKVVKVNEIIDMRFSFSSDSLYYFESTNHANGSCKGQYWKDHDRAQGRDIPVGDPWWVSVKTTGLEDWVGRLEFSVVINGRRIRERKPFRIHVKEPPFDMDKYPMFVEELISGERMQ